MTSTSGVSSSSNIFFHFLDDSEHSKHFLKKKIWKIFPDSPENFPDSPENFPDSPENFPLDVLALTFYTEK